MICVIVPSHNQGKYIHSIIQGYENQTKVPDLVLFVFDRCTDDSISTFCSTKSTLNIRYVEKTKGENFSAGMTRDCGVDYLNKFFPDYTTIIFTDGDCVPSPRLVELHVDNTEQSELPIVSCGKRLSETIDGGFVEDVRNLDTGFKKAGFTNTNGRVVLSRRYALESIYTFSCNFAFNKKAIQICKYINLKISNSNRVFNPEFDGKWGGEDNFISNCLFRTGGLILLCSQDCFVEHFYHPENENTDTTRVQICKDLDSKIVKEILEHNTEFEYTELEKIKNINCPPVYMYNNIHSLNTTESIVQRIVKKIPKNIIDIDPHTLHKYLSFILSRVYKFVDAKEPHRLVYEYDETYVYQLTDAISKLKVYYRSGVFIVDENIDVDRYSRQIDVDAILAKTK